MKIIIVGNGKVGYAIARQLAVEGHDITMVDSSPVALARADSTLDIMCVEGNGASISVLEEAGARTADLVIAVSNLDETNLVCCLIAKTMGAKHTIARVRNPDYRRDAALRSGRSGWTWSSTPIWRRHGRSPASSASPPPPPWSPSPAAVST
ncbi:MAG: NAD-binding protein [Oscillospiraceae bacterium]